MTAFLEQGRMGAKYPRLRSEKIMTAYLGYKVNVMKKKMKKRTVIAGFQLVLG